jgi:hypothetical protein
MIMGRELGMGNGAWGSRGSRGSRGRKNETNSQFAIRNDARGLALRVANAIKSRQTQREEGFLPALGYKDCFSTRRYRERATCGRKRVAGRSTVLNLYFFDKELIPNSQFPMPNAQCPMPNAQCPIPNSQCPIPNTQFPMPNSPIFIVNG